MCILQHPIGFLRCITYMHKLAWTQKYAFHFNMQRKFARGPLSGLRVLKSEVAAVPYSALYTIERLEFSVQYQN